MTENRSQRKKKSMSKARQPRRSSKRALQEDDGDVNLTADTLPESQQQESHAPMMAQTISDALVISAPEAIVQAYHHLLTSNPDALTFLSRQISSLP